MKTALSSESLSQSRGWLMAGGILSILTGLLALSFPLFFSIFIAQFLGVFALVSGAISLFLALFGTQTTHRILEAISCLGPSLTGLPR